ncbi:MAG TPA: hypothetical protein PKO36_11655 [Candidatus Hydrogenedentes bacterium]|nr:hypothetical protein [Candidatus Hydrogenedentota bacterium]HOT51514.1 hypothetical protein [Candidatus Hydrogenedentota bacterium]HOV75834.1 hypothetical protein [Candidatus Hydrogenedentota bacterium]HPC15640.1 hypothetical protein [Candidatus Hydrogenedentota bacterium]HRT19460.1 hypothetical protein [Candidatus Hydrogenedentota bacterium]
MNPLLAQQIKQILRDIKDLKTDLHETQRQLKKITAARDEMQTRLWSQSKELAVFKERMDEYATLKLENDRHKAMQEEIEQRLAKILEYTEALTAEIRA